MREGRSVVRDLLLLSILCSVVATRIVLSAETVYVLIVALGTLELGVALGMYLASRRADASARRQAVRLHRESVEAGFSDGWRRHE